MIRKLRRRFIVSSMLALFMVLFLIMSVVNLVNYRGVVKEADQVLALLAENGGDLLDAGRGGPGGFEMEGDFDPGQEPNPGEGPGDEGFSKRKWTLGRGRGGRLESPELPFEIRYFIVELDESGQPEETQLGRIAAVDEDTACQLALRAGTRKKGFIGDYRFLRAEREDGAQIIFLDCGQNMLVVRSFLLTSGLISLAGMAAVFGLILFFSRKVMSPVAESYAKQRRFITDAGHELKTPLAIINADADVLGMDIGEDNEWLSDIQAQTGRMAELTADLIQLARMEEPDAARFVEFPLSDTVEEQARAFQTAAQAQDKDYAWDVEPGLSLKGDQNAVKRLASILLDNAVKYSDEGGKIRLTLKKQGRYARLTAYNTSGVVDPADIGHLFERFYRSEKSRNSEKGGSGIGLSIAQAVALAHKGKISAATDDGKSLRITVDLPM